MKLFNLILLLSSVSIFAQTRPERPNIVVIFSDDHGFQDVEAMDAKGQSWIGNKDWETPFETPFMDQLIASGKLFVQGYSASPVCSPSRGAMLAGKAPVSLGRMWVVGGAPPEETTNLVIPYYRGRLPETEITVAEVLNTAGYLSGHIGKWHCGWNHTTFPNAQDQGFQKFFVHTRGVTSRGSGARTNDAYFDDNVTDYSNMYARSGAADFNFPTTFPSDAVTEGAVDFIQKGVDEQKPFFLYLATWLVHTPIHSRNQALLEYYTKKMLGSDKTIADLPAEGSAGEMYAKQNNPFYGAMVTTLDWTVGNVMDKLRNTDDPRWPGHKLIENTYVFFAADNGGLETSSGEPVTDNFPLDLGKANLREGGIHVPFFIAGPGIEAGSIEETMVIHYDIYPTILDLTNTPKPAEQRIEGVSLKPLLFDEDEQLQYTDHPYFKDQFRDVLVWHVPKKQQTALRKGGWKLIKNYLNKTVFSNTGTNPFTLFQLYADDLKTPVDLGEQNDLAAQRPDKVAELDSILTEYLAAFEYGEPNYISSTAANLTAEYNTKKSQIPVFGNASIQGDSAFIDVTLRGANVDRVFFIYTKGSKGEMPNGEWFRVKANINNAGNRISVKVPARTENYQFYLVDENNFMVISETGKSTIPYTDCPVPDGYLGESGNDPIMMGDECYEVPEIVTVKHLGNSITEYSGPVHIYDMNGRIISTRKKWDGDYSRLNLRTGIYFMKQGGTIQKYFHIQ